MTWRPIDVFQMVAVAKSSSVYNCFSPSNYWSIASLFTSWAYLLIRQNCRGCMQDRSFVQQRSSVLLDLKGCAAAHNDMPTIAASLAQLLIASLDSPITCDNSPPMSPNTTVVTRWEFQHNIAKVTMNNRQPSNMHEHQVPCSWHLQPNLKQTLILVSEDPTISLVQTQHTTFHPRIRFRVSQLSAMNYPRQFYEFIRFDQSHDH